MRTIAGARIGVLALAIVAARSVTGTDVTTSVPDPFAFLPPGVEMNGADRGRLDAGRTVIRVLPGRDRELALMAAVRIDAPPERLLSWTSRIAPLLQSRYVPIVVRFSSPPRIEDLSALELEEGDLNDLRNCRPGDCGVKLSAGDIARLQQRITGRSDWKPGVQQEFRRIVLDRTATYLSDGDLGLPPYNDHRDPIAADAEFASLIRRLGLLPPGISEYLQAYPRIGHPDVVESFLYWSKETLGGKPIVSVTHAALVRGAGSTGAPALVVSKQVFATHYRTGAVSMTAIAGSSPNRSLVYLHRSHVDVLQGFFAGLVRRIVEGRIRDEAPAVLNAIRARLERSNPP